MTQVTQQEEFEYLLTKHARSQVATQARKSERLRITLSLVMQQAASRTLRHTCRQRIVERLEWNNGDHR